MFEERLFYRTGGGLSSIVHTSIAVGFGSYDTDGPTLISTR